MVFTSPSDKSLFKDFEAFLSSSTPIHSENLHPTRETQRILSKKRLLKGHKLKLKKKLMYPFPTTQVITTALPISIPTAPILETCYHYQPDYNYPLVLNDWHPMNSPLFTVQPVPIIVPSPSPIFAANISPFAGTVVQPVVAPLVSQTFLQDELISAANYLNEYNFTTDLINNVLDTKNEEIFHEKEKANTHLEETIKLCNEVESVTHFDNLQSENDPVEIYLTLPKELFPTAKMMTLDPNPIIDEFCKATNLQHHTPWLLDLEFGIPRNLITRPIPTYNVKFNSIHCKNSPDAIHPGFESCDPNFKKVLLFYYDSIVSAWYRGYIIMHCDRSVENFQSWLRLPMQVLGMCWP